MKQSRTRGAGRRWTPATLLCGSVLTLVLMAVLSGCDTSSSPKVSSNSVSLAQLSWCDRPLIEFQDSGTTTQATISNWDKVRDQLGFTVYLPPSLPKGSCLVLAGGTIHDPIYGGHMSITYDVASSGPISFSEAPKRANLGGKVQCTQDAQSKTTTVCLGTISGTSITIASRQPQADLQALFGSLKGDVDWVPTTTDKLLATPSPTGG